MEHNSGKEDQAEESKGRSVHVLGQCKAGEKAEPLAMRGRRLRKSIKRTSPRSALRMQKHLTWFTTYLEHALTNLSQPVLPYVDLCSLTVSATLELPTIAMDREEDP